MFDVTVRTGAQTGRLGGQEEVFGSRNCGASVALVAVRAETCVALRIAAETLLENVVSV